MELFFLRHGQTAFNHKMIHQPPEAALTKRGLAEANAAATAVASLQPTHLFTSSLWRAIETAEAIAATTGVPATPSDLFCELQRPPHIHGCRHFGFRSMRYMWQWFFNTDPTYWDRHGGESRAAFLARLYEAKRFLQTLPPDARVVVVSHSIFINFFLAHICDESPISFFRGVLLLMKILGLKNGEMVHATYQPQAAKDVCAWVYDVSFTAPSASMSREE